MGKELFLWGGDEQKSKTSFPKLKKKYFCIWIAIKQRVKRKKKRHITHIVLELFTYLLVLL